MKKADYHIEKNSIQEALIIPLFGRLICSEHYPELFSDPSANMTMCPIRTAAATRPASPNAASAR